MTRLKAQVKRLERDLDDALNFATVPIYRCPACRRYALCQGLICQSCGYDPSFSVEEYKKGRA